MGIAQQRPSKFNLYDIFANFLPGAVLLIGLSFPYLGIDGLFASLNTGGLLLMLVLSFAAGLFVQAVGGNVQSSGRDFADHIQNVDRYADVEDERYDADVDAEINISTLDAYFVEAFRAELGLTSDFDDWSRLHKLILAKLEATSRTRALRLQALFLAMRGMAVTMALLAVWFVLYMVFATINLFPATTPIWALPYLSLLWLCIAGVLYDRAGEFSRDVTKYMIIEYYLEIIERQERSVELDFLDEPDERRSDPEDGTEPEPEVSETTAEEEFERAKTQLVEEDEERASDDSGDDEDNPETDR